MVDLPKLPDNIARVHVLQWKELIKSHRFTGDHLQWHQSPDRRREAAKPFYPSLAASLRTDKFSDERIRSTLVYVETCNPSLYEKWKEPQLVSWAARVIDSIGISETVALAKARFKEVVPDYLEAWAADNGNSDEFARRLVALRHSVVC